MGWQNLIQLGITLALAFLPWLFPNWAWYAKLIVLLLVVIVSITVSCLRLQAKLSDLSKKMEYISERHIALATQFDEKIRLEKNFRSIFANLSIMLHVAIQSTDKAKLDDIYHAFLLAQATLNEGGSTDGKSLQDRQNHQ